MDGDKSQKGLRAIASDMMAASDTAMWQWATLPTGTTVSAMGRPPEPLLADPKQQAKREAATLKKQRQRAAIAEKKKYHG